MMSIESSLARKKGDWTGPSTGGGGAGAAPSTRRDRSADRKADPAATVRVIVVVRTDAAARKDVR